MRKNRRERNVVRRPDLQNYSPRVDLGKEKINLTTKRRERPHIQDFTSASTNVFSLVSLVLMIALIATIIISSPMRTNKEKFTFFSPSRFLSSLSSTTIVIPAGEYVCSAELSEFNSGLALSNFRAAIVDQNGNVYRSDNTVNAYIAPWQDFRFTINGQTYITEWRPSSDYPYDELDMTWHTLGIVPVLIFDQTISVDLMTFPDFSVVAEAWRDATLLNWTDALSATGKFFFDMIAYQGNVLSAVLPWNTVASSEDVTDMQIPWRDEQNNYIEP